MNKNMKLFIIAVSVFCSYLIVSLPFSSALQINIIFNQATQDSVIVNPQGLVSKELSIEHDSLWSKVNAHLEIRVSQPQYEIKRAYIYFCGGLDPVDCITKDPVTFESYVNVSKDWNDILSGKPYQYPQTSNILSIVRVDIGGKITWTGFWDQIERTSAKEFKIRSFDTSSVDVYLKSLDDLNLTRTFIENYRMIPTQWIDSTSFGLINQADTQVLYGIGADQVEMPRLRPWQTIGKVVGETGKEYELVFPGTSSLTANPVVINSNPPYVCGNSVCETGSGEDQENCCVDCTDPGTRACTGDLEGYTCYTDSDNPYGTCTFKCGNSVCEKGESSTTCCADCSCDTGFLCDVSQWLPSGSCINSSAINLILDSAKTEYKSCEIPHEVELSVHVMNAPSDMNVQQWYYIINNETGTSISADRISMVEAPNTSAPHMYTLKIHLDPLTECRSGTYNLQPNRLFALITYSGSKEFKELSTDLPAINIIQETISMKQIQENLKERMQAVMDFIKEGIGLVRMMLMICIVTILSMLIMSILGGLSYAFDKSVDPWEEAIKQAGLSGPENLENMVSFEEDEPIVVDLVEVKSEANLEDILGNYDDGQVLYSGDDLLQKATDPGTGKPTLFQVFSDGTKTVVDTTKVVAGGTVKVVKSAWSTVKTGTKKVAGGFNRVAGGFMRFFKAFHEGLRIGLEISKTVCEITSLIIGIFTSITNVWTKYISFQSCMEVYENHMGKGICDQSPESCVSEMRGCLNSLNGIKQDAENMIPQIGTTGYTGGTGSISAYLSMFETGKSGAVKETCNGRNIYFNLGYGPYGEISAYLVVPKGIEGCYDRALSESEFKNMLPRGIENAKPANHIFECGTGRYYFTLKGDGKDIGTFNLYYREECTDPSSVISRDTRTEVGGYLTSARDIADGVKKSLDSKTQNDNIVYLTGAIRAMDDAKKAVSDGDKDDTLEDITNARGKIGNAKSGLAKAIQDELDDAVKKLDDAKKALD